MLAKERILDRILIASGLSDFERDVLIEASRIKRGRTITYAELAERIGRIGSQRAVGNALNKNPLPLLIPCHRVVGSRNIGGYALGTALKRFFLFIESVL